MFKMRARTVVINVEETDEDIESGRVTKPRASHASQIQLQDIKDKKRRQHSTEPHKHEQEHEKKRSSTLSHNSSFASHSNKASPRRRHADQICLPEELKADSSRFLNESIRSDRSRSSSRRKSTILTKHSVSRYSEYTSSPEVIRPKQIPTYSTNEHTVASVLISDNENPEEVKQVRNIATRKLEPLRTFEADEISSINSNPEHTDRKRREPISRKSNQAL